MLYTHMLYHNDSIIKTHTERRKRKTHRKKRRRIKTQEDFFNNIFTSHFIARVRKGCSRVCMWEGAGDRTYTSYFDPTVMIVTLCLSCSFRCSTRGLGVHSIGASEDPSVGCGLPYHIWSLAVWNSAGNCIGGFRGPPRSGVAFPTTSHL